MLELVKKFLIIAVFILSSSLASGQNWMMAQHYMSLAIDSLIQRNWPVTGKLEGFLITYIDYDEVFEEFTIQFTDTIECNNFDILLKDGEEPGLIVQTGELVVGLKGGEAIYEDENGEITSLELPDLSEVVYILNEVGAKIFFSLSNDNINFEEFSLDSGEFNIYPCTSDNAFIIITTVTGEKETGRVHYKLEKGKGYKVKYDAENSRFDVYLDERMSIEDFKE